MVSVVASVIILISSAVISTLDNILRRFNYCAIHGPLRTLNFIVPTSLFISLHCLKLRAMRRSQALNRIFSSRMNVILILLMSVYAVSSASTLIGYILACHTDIYIYSNIYTMHIDFIIVLTFMFNCAVNPFIYFFSSPPIAQLFSKIWHRLCNTCKVWYNGNAQEIEMNNIPPAWGYM